MLRGRSKLISAVGLALGVLFLCAATSAQASAGYTTKGAYTFVSEPNLHPPILHTDFPAQTSKLAPGYFMVANLRNVGSTQPLTGQGGPLILDSHLQPVWFDPVPTNVVTENGIRVLTGATANLTEQTYEGKPVLSWWQGSIGDSDNTATTVSGEDFVVNQQYQQVATLTAAAPWVLSEHEFLIQGSDAWVTAYRNVAMDLTPYGGPKNGVVIDASVQEYSLKTGKLLYLWDALDHIPLSDSETKPVANGLWDAYHENSISLTGPGTFLVSMRSEWAAYEVNINTGNIEWTLGNGAHSNFKFVPSSAQFQWQHDVELHPGDVISVFDDHCCNFVGAGKLVPPTGPSRGLVLKLNFKQRTATLVHQYKRANIDSDFLGNADLLPDGNVAIGWGSQQYFSEYSQSGKLLFDAVWPAPDQSYRAFVQRWVGTPYFPPSGAVRTAHGKSTMYASWDGATQVVGWRVLAGSNAKRLKLVATKGKTGFETAISLKSSYNAFEVQAVNGAGRVIGTSKQFTVPKRGSAPSSPGFY